MPVRKKAPEDLTAKKALALEVIRRLKAEYPDAGCTLDYDHAWQLLVSVRLAAQCTDARVNIVVEELFAKYPSVADHKANFIAQPDAVGVGNDGGLAEHVPHNEVCALAPYAGQGKQFVKGVGHPAVVLVPQHPHTGRDIPRLGMSQSAGLDDGFNVLRLGGSQQIIPPEEGSDLCHRFVMHGRAVCNARKPECEKCCLKDICRTAREAAGQQAEP